MIKLSRVEIIEHLVPLYEEMVKLGSAKEVPSFHTMTDEELISEYCLSGLFKEFHPDKKKIYPELL